MEKQNGIITSYSIKYTGIDGEDDKPHEILGIAPDTTQYLLEQLEKWTEYRISVTAHTDVGPGPESESVLLRTDEDGMLPPTHQFDSDSLSQSALYDLTPLFLKVYPNFSEKF